MFCDFLIIFGLLILLVLLDCVGLMDELLFIDNIDMDWCFWVMVVGLGLYGVCDV